MRRPEVTLAELESVRGQSVFSADGEKVGKVEEVYYDAATGVAEWVGIGTGFLGLQRVLVPAEGVHLDAGDDGVRLQYSKAFLRDSPGVAREVLSQEAERKLYEYFGIPASERQSLTHMRLSGSRRVPS